MSADADGPVVVLGDALLDVDLRGVSRRHCPDAPAPVLEESVAWYRPGGAALAALCLASNHREVVLVTALGRDSAARTLAEALDGRVTLVALPLMDRTPTKTRIQANGRTVVRVDEGSGGVERDADAAEVARALEGAAAVLVSDYGSGLTRQRAVREALAASAPRTPLVWDPHPRGAEPVPGTCLVTPNAAEAGVRVGTGSGTGTTAGTGAGGDVGEEALRRAGELARVWGADSVAVTLGGHGAAWADARGRGLLLPAEPVRVATDTCGAGDGFAASATAALADGADPADAARAGVRAATRFVAAGGASAHARPRSGQGGALTPAHGHGAAAVVERARARGDRVVATGGCFDVLHAGHIDLLRRARALGDCLVVLLNSDSSVRALKGEGRPVVAERDRARVLSALGYVDAVAVFDEETPVSALEALRPDVWVKGGDYDVEELPETPAVRRGGGEVVTVPLMPGHSTTGLLRRIRARGHDGLAAR